MDVHVIQPELNDAIFGAKTRAHLLHQAVVMQLQSTSSAARARDCILAHYDWAANLRTIDPLFEPPPVLETRPHASLA